MLGNLPHSKSKFIAAEESIENV